MSELGDCATELMEARGAVSTEDDLIAATHGNGAGLLVWRYDGVLYALLSERPEDLGILLATRARVRCR